MRVIFKCREFSSLTFTYFISVTFFFIQALISKELLTEKCKIWGTFLYDVNLFEKFAMQDSQKF